VFIPFVDVKAQYESIKNELDEAIQQVIDSCAFIGGRFCQEFEDNFAKACDAPFCVGCSSGTTALELALHAYEVGVGDEVILPSHTFIATAEVISNVGAKPVFCEMNETDYLMDTKDLESRITDRTKVIIPVHLYGQSVDMDALFEIAERYDLKIIEDCAQAHLAEYKGGRVPIGEVGCFSFFPGKNLGAYGDAGAIVTKSPEIAKKVREYLNHGRRKEEKYIHHSIGTNYRMDGIQGAVLNVKLKYLPKWIEHRREVAQRYNEELERKEEILIPKENNDCFHVYHLYVIRVKNRDGYIEKLKENEVSCGIHYPVPLHLQPAYEFLKYKKGDFSVTERVVDEILSLPICGSIGDEALQKVVSLI